MAAIEGTVKATIRRKGGETLAEIDIPRSLDNVPLNRFINFLVECRKFGEEDVVPALVMANAVSDFCDYPLAEIIQAEVGDIHGEEAAGLTSSISQIFGYISQMVMNAKGEPVDPENAFFEIEGERFLIPVVMQQALAGEYTLPTFSVIEVIEAAEIKRLTQTTIQQKGDPNGFIKARIMSVAAAETETLPEGDPRRITITKAAETLAAAEIEKAADPSGSLLYSMYLRLLAIICRKEGEHLPFDDAEREAWITNRAAFFRGISAKKALDVDFFLTSILSNYDSAPPAAGFLTRQSFSLAAAMQLKTPKGKAKRRHTTKKSLGA